MFAVLRRNFGEVDLDQVVPLNTTVILQCKPPGGSPRPNITWYKNGEPLFFRRGRRVRVNAKGDLLIRRLRTNDTGKYQCVAENMVARREGMVITLEVRGLSLCCFLGDVVSSMGKPGSDADRKSDKKHSIIAKKSIFNQCLLWEKLQPVPTARKHFSAGKHTRCQARENKKNRGKTCNRCRARKKMHGPKA